MKECVHNRRVHVLQKARFELSKIPYECPTCQLEGLDETNVRLDPACFWAWRDFFTKDIIKVNWVFGYLDQAHTASGDAVLDKGYSTAAMEIITGTCRDPNVLACKFNRSKDRDGTEFFYKFIKGPVGEKEHRVEIRITSSSYSDSEKENQKNSTLQSRATERAENAFFGDIEQSDLLLYWGHHRGGGGPDFAPARRLKTGAVDMAFYKKEQPGLKRLEKALIDAKSRPKLIGIFAGAGDRFSNVLIKSAPQTGFVTGHAGYVDSEFSQAYTMLEGVLQKRCEGGFNQSLGRRDIIDGMTNEPSEIKNFFERFKNKTSN